MSSIEYNRPEKLKPFFTVALLMPIYNHASDATWLAVSVSNFLFCQELDWPFPGTKNNK